jgi:hypothetical protein
MACPAYTAHIAVNAGGANGTVFAWFAPRCDPTDSHTTAGQTTHRSSPDSGDRAPPATPPLLVWSSGGPGCSGLLANFGELGPMLMTPTGALKANPASWTRAAHVLFVDAPLNVGFSTASTPNMFVPTTHLRVLHPCTSTSVSPCLPLCLQVHCHRVLVPLPHYQ